jgi:hypothetical protein
MTRPPTIADILEREDLPRDEQTRAKVEAVCYAFLVHGRLRMDVSAEDEQPDQTPEDQT